MKPSHDVKISILDSEIHGIGGTAFSSVCVELKHHCQVAILCSVVHREVYTTLTPILVKSLYDLQVTVLLSDVHYTGTKRLRNSREVTGQSPSVHQPLLPPAGQ